MHAIRVAVRENPLSTRSGIDERSYRRFVDEGAAWVAETGPAVIGFAAMDFDVAKVWAVFVAPGAEGEGAGQALQRAMVQAAEARGLTQLSLSTSPGTRAERFYRLSGWQPAGQTPDGEVLLKLEIGAR